MSSIPFMHITTCEVQADDEEQAITIANEKVIFANVADMAGDQEARLGLEEEDEEDEAEDEEVEEKDDEEEDDEDDEEEEEEEEEEDAAGRFEPARRRGTIRPWVGG